MVTAESAEKRLPPAKARRRLLVVLAWLAAALVSIVVAPLNVPVAIGAGVVGFRLAFPRSQPYALVGLAVLLVAAVLAVGTTVISVWGWGTVPAQPF